MQPQAKDIIRSSIITAFTIAAALIWKDVITAVIATMVPAGEELLYQVFAAIGATVLVILGIYLFIRTEERAEYMIDKAERYTHFGKYRNTKVSPGDKVEGGKNSASN